MKNVSVFDIVFILIATTILALANEFKEHLGEYVTIIFVGLVHSSYFTGKWFGSKFKKHSKPTAPKL